MSYNTFHKDTWAISDKGWFIGYVITKTQELAEVRMAHPDKKTDEKGSCVIVSCQDIPDSQCNENRYILFGPKHWFKTKTEAKKYLKANPLLEVAE